MSQYTTGELAKACGVTVRTVQFYDQRGILIPSALTEGGRRLYSEDDLRRMRIICFLRDTGLTLDTIRKLLEEENPGSVIDILLEQQEEVLKEEISARQEKLSRLEELKKEIRKVSSFSVEIIGDIANLMENKKKMSAMHRNMVLTGIPVSLLQWGSIILWIIKGIWWSFILWIAVAIPYGVLWSRYYYRHVKYICPQCHEVFRPAFREMFWARHTPKTRKLTCVKCGYHGFCVEIWGGN